MTSLKTCLSHRAILEIQGEDRAFFLQGLITNDIYAVTPTHTIYTTLLTPQGRFLYDFFISEGNDAYFLEVERPRLAALVQKLSLYKLRSRVSLLPRPEIPVYALWGEGAVSEGESRGHTKGNLFVDPRLSSLGLRGRGEDNFPAFKAVPFEDYVLHRLELGVPEGGEDLIPEKSIPLESRLDALNAVSWTKGCYMGQELTARTKYRGLVRKCLFPVTLEGPPPSFGAPILKNGKAVGEMRTSLKEKGLALLRLEALEEDGDFTCENTIVRPYTPSWMV